MKILLATITLLLSISVSYSQDTLALSNVEKVHFLTNRLAKELQLTNDQKIELKILFEQRFAKKNKVRPERFKAINNQVHTRFKDILSKEQYQKYLKLKREKQQQRQKYLKEHPDYKFSKEDEELDF